MRKPRWKSTLTKRENTLSLRVADDGPGFPPEALKRGTDPYYRGEKSEAKERTPHFGLGLTICKHCAKSTAAASFCKTGPLAGPRSRRFFSVEKRACRNFPVTHVVLWALHGYEYRVLKQRGMF